MWTELSDVQKEEYKRRANEINAENAKLLEEYYQQHPEEKARDEENEKTKKMQRYIKNAPGGFITFAVVNTFGMDVKYPKKALRMCRKCWDELDENTKKTAAVIEASNKKQKQDIDAQFTSVFEACLL